METKHFKIKICLVGEQGVGKTSLIHRFVSGAFDESYIRTLGVLVSKKTVTLDDPPRSVRADLMVSDIMGKHAFLDLFKDAYFHGTQGVLAVFDGTRRRSLGLRGKRRSVPLRRQCPYALRVCSSGITFHLRHRKTPKLQDLRARKCSAARQSCLAGCIGQRNRFHG